MRYIDPHLFFAAASRLKSYLENGLGKTGRVLRARRFGSIFQRFHAIRAYLVTNS